MRGHHRQVFFDAAQRCTCWIGLREPNELLERWVGVPGFIPKGEKCKAKTADEADSPLGGLVVNPIEAPGAFRRQTRSDAVRIWNTKFLEAGRLPAGFTCVPSGPRKGLVLYEGSAIFSDYDLMAIVRSDAAGKWLPTSNVQEKRLFEKVEPILRLGLRVPMIQHPTEFMWTGGVGARALEWVLWFGPGRRFNRSLSSMPEGGH